MKLIESLKTIGRIETELKASSWTWLATGGKPLFTFFPDNADDLATFIKNKPKDLAYRTFGAASNVLVRDGDNNGMCYAGAFIRLMKGFRELTISDNQIIASAGLPGSFIVNKALEQELGGISFMATIPGNLGGLIAMNAGAHGNEMKNVIQWVEVLDENGEIQRLENRECQFEYRSSSVRKSWIIIRACINTQKGKRDEIANEIHKLIAYRKATQPINGKMAGCFFKNPADTNQKAWQLMRNAQMPKSDSVGICAVHANFIMNKNNATAFDLEYFALQLQADIFFRQNVWLEMEIERIGYGNATKSSDNS